VAIYMASSMCRIISGDSKGWTSVSWWVASFFLGIAFLKVTVLNFILCGSDSTGTRHHLSFLLHLVVWNFGAIDIAGRISPWGHRWKEPITFPLRNPTRSFKKIPSQNYPSWLLVLGAEGTLLPRTGTLFTSSSFSIPSSICLGQL
jgi:hypothetical protein